MAVLAGRLHLKEKIVWICFQAKKKYMGQKKCANGIEEKGSARKNILRKYAIQVTYNNLQRSPE